MLYTLDGFFASGQSCAHATFLSPVILEVYGTLCATVKRVATICSQEPSAAFDDVKSWTPEGPGDSSYINGQAMLDAYVGTLTINRTFEYMKMSQLIKMEDARNRFLATLGDSNLPADKESLLNDSFVEVILRRCVGAVLSLKPMKDTSVSRQRKPKLVLTHPLYLIIL